MNATTAMLYSSTASAAPSSTQRVCPEGIDRAIQRIGMSLAEWAQNRADRKAAVRRSPKLSGLSDHERAQLLLEATAQREAAYAARARWHIIG